MKKKKHTVKFTVDLKPVMVNRFDSIALNNEIKWAEPINDNMYDGSLLNRYLIDDLISFGVCITKVDESGSARVDPASDIYEAPTD